MSRPHCYLCLTHDFATENAILGGLRLCSRCQAELIEERTRLEGKASK